MTAYYNEIDPDAAQWLRNLIAAGLIADGWVDERSIEHVHSDELRGFTQCHFFAGVGVWSHALRRAGWPDDRPVWTGSCPCQPFSAAGEGLGFADERHLWPAWHHLIRVHRPPVVFGEQVASKDGLEWLDLVQSDMEGEDYAFGASDLCAAGVGAPHIRQRLWFVAHPRGARVRDQGRRAHAGAPRGAEGAGPQRQRVRHNAGHGGDGAALWVPAGVLDDADEARSQGHRIAQAQGRDEADGVRPAAGSTGPAGATGLVALADAPGQRALDGQRGEPLGDARPAGDAAAPGGAHALADDHEVGREEQRAQRLHDHGQPGNDAAGRGASSLLADAELHDGPGWAGEAHGDGAVEPDRRRDACPTAGFWVDAEWIPCRDGKWRPVEPGTFPLVNGAPSRVVRLRAYGNAIVSEAAVAFIEASGLV